MKVGIVGCGVISANYAENASAFDFELAACADIQHSYAEALAAKHGIGALAMYFLDPVSGPRRAGGRQARLQREAARARRRYGDRASR